MQSSVSIGEITHSGSVSKWRQQLRDVNTHWAYGRKRAASTNGCDGGIVETIRKVHQSISFRPSPPDQGEKGVYRQSRRRRGWFHWRSHLHWCPWAHDSEWWCSAGHHMLQGCIGRAPAGQSWQGWVALSGLQLGRVDQSWWSGLSSSLGLLQRSVLSRYQQTCWDELPSALLLGQPLFANRGSLAFLPSKALSSTLGAKCCRVAMHVYIYPWRVRGNTWGEARGTVAVLFPGSITVIFVDRRVYVSPVCVCVWECVKDFNVPVEILRRNWCFVITTNLSLYSAFYFGCCLQQTDKSCAQHFILVAVFNRQTKAVSFRSQESVCEQVNAVERGARHLLSEKGHSALVVSFARHPDGVALVSDKREFKRLLPPTFKPKTPNLILCSRGSFLCLILLPAFQCVCMLCFQMCRRSYKVSGTLF